MGGVNGSLDLKHKKKKKHCSRVEKGAESSVTFETTMIVLCRDHEHTASLYVQLLHRSLSNVKLCN